MSAMRDRELDCTSVRCHVIGHCECAKPCKQCGEVMEAVTMYQQVSRTAFGYDVIALCRDCYLKSTCVPLESSWSFYP